MARTEASDYLLLALPWPLFYVVFNLALEWLVLAMSLAASTLAAFALALKPSLRSRLPPSRGWLLAWPLGALALYFVFIAGGAFSVAVGMWWQVLRVYSSLTRTPVELAAVFVVGLAEEVFWRGYLQEDLIVSRLGRPWWLSAIPYSLVHLVSGLPLLILAAAPVGLVTGLLARKWGVACSAAAHIAWLYLVLYIAPVPAILGA
ncbi:MAG: CPBP family intramembrane glutamic endopeptidase [Thermofilum sp.]